MKNLNLQNKTVLVVGGSSGIGQAVAGLAAQAGARLIITGRDAAKLATAVKTLQAAGA
jgi:NAD(P)-dependent dehydrogenase (short-subunit alcohol dehydrogenase family)